jgi:hypothetical protein
VDFIAQSEFSQEHTSGDKAHIDPAGLTAGLETNMNVILAE